MNFAQLRQVHTSSHTCWRGKQLLQTFQQSSSGGSAFLREVVGVIPAVSVDIDQREAVIAEDTSVAVDAAGEIPKRHAVHLALFAIKAVDVS